MPSRGLLCEIFANLHLKLYSCGDQISCEVQLLITELVTVVCEGGPGGLGGEPGLEPGGQLGPAEVPPLAAGLPRGDEVTGGQQGEDLLHNLSRQNEDTGHFDMGTQGSNFHKKIWIFSTLV